MKAFKEIRELVVKEDIDHSRYKKAHDGKKAKGNGVWMFTTKSSGDVDFNNDKEVFQSTTMSLQAAGKAAMKALGVKKVYVMEAFKPYMNKETPRIVDFYIQFRGGKGDWITSPDNKKDYEKALKLTQDFMRKNKIKTKLETGTPEQGSSAYKISLILNKKKPEYRVDLRPLVDQISKFKTAEDHGGGYDKPLKEFRMPPMTMARDNAIVGVELKEEDKLDEAKSKFSKALLKKATDTALKMSGNMTGAVKEIEKMKKGLSKDKEVAAALQLANEEVSEAILVAAHEIDEATKAGKGKVKLDIDWIGDKKLAADVKKKYNVTVKPTGRTTADISGNKQDIVKMMLAPDVMGFDQDDLEDLFPELFEAVAIPADEAEQSPKQKKYQAFFKKALKKFGVKSPQELERDKRKKFFDYVDANWEDNARRVGSATAYRS